ncbi:MAG: hypothetical protein ABSD67_23700 [Terracidiphilus sp.]|jgi:hypothetical protein
MKAIVDYECGDSKKPTSGDPKRLPNELCWGRASGKAGAEEGHRRDSKNGSKIECDTSRGKTAAKHHYDCNYSNPEI